MKITNRINNDGSVTMVYEWPDVATYQRWVTAFTRVVTENPIPVDAVNEMAEIRFGKGWRSEP